MSFLQTLITQSSQMHNMYLLYSCSLMIKCNFEMRFGCLNSLNNYLSCFLQQKHFYSLMRATDMQRINNLDLYFNLSRNNKLFNFITSYQKKNLGLSSIFLKKHCFKSHLHSITQLNNFKCCYNFNKFYFHVSYSYCMISNNCIKQSILSVDSKKKNSD